MLIELTEDQLDSFAYVGTDGGFYDNAEALSALLEEALGIEQPRVSFSELDYQTDSAREPILSTRIVEGIAWVSLGNNRCRRWGFRSEGLALSITDEGEQLCPVSEDADLVAQAISIVAKSYPGAVIDQRDNRLTVQRPNGRTMKARVLVIHDPRINRMADVLSPMDYRAYNAIELGVAVVRPNDDGQMVITKFCLD